MAKRATARQIYLDPPPPRADMRVCEHPDCTAEGGYRAPRSRDPESGHYWFCLDHVREYNANWDFFRGMSADDVERYIRNNATWQRPTWKIGTKPGDDFFGAFVKDDLGLLSEVGLGPEARAQRKRKAEEQRVNPDSPEGRYIAALAILDLKPGATEKEIKARYKELAKRHHPDRNGGDKAAEERLKEINQAYTVLVARPAV